MSLHSEIQHENVKTYNSTNEASGKAILKEYTERYTAEPDCLEDWDSDCDDDRGDEEMEDSEWGVILFIPFQTGCKIVSVSVMTVDSATASTSSPEPSPPTKLRLYPNVDNLDFSSLNDAPPPAQVIQLVTTTPAFGASAVDAGSIDYPVQPARFNNCNCLTIHVTGGNPVRITYIGLKGKGGINNARRAVECVYESRGVIGDGHKVLDGGVEGSYE